MKKNYQTKTAPAATAEFVMPDTVAVAMEDLAETVRGCWPWPSGLGCRSCR